MTRVNDEPNYDDELVYCDDCGEEVKNLPYQEMTNVLCYSCYRSKREEDEDLW